MDMMDKTDFINPEAAALVVNEGSGAAGGGADGTVIRDDLWCCQIYFWYFGVFISCMIMISLMPGSVMVEGSIMGWIILGSCQSWVEYAVLLHKKGPRSFMGTAFGYSCLHNCKLKE